MLRFEAVQDLRRGTESTHCWRTCGYTVYHGSEQDVRNLTSCVTARDPSSQSRGQRTANFLKRPYVGKNTHSTQHGSCTTRPGQLPEASMTLFRPRCFLNSSPSRLPQRTCNPPEHACAAKTPISKPNNCMVVLLYVLPYHQFGRVGNTVDVGA